MFKRFSLYLFLILSFTGAAAAYDSSWRDLKISGAWARHAISPNNNSAAYMVIVNDNDKECVITGASAPKVANNVELHKSFVDEKGISRMTSIDRIVIPARSKIELKPGGIHVMLFDLKKNLKAGDKFTIELELEKRDPSIENMNAEVTVK